MSEYLECIGLFYDEKLKFLSAQDKYISCKGCPSTKQFKETYEEISLTCGDTGKECGMKINIKFPKYLNYSNGLEELKNKMEEGINLNVLNKYIDQEGKLTKEETRIKKLEAEIDNIKKRVYEINIENKKERIQKFYNKRVEKTSKCDRLFKNLKGDSLPESSKEILRKEYVTLIRELNDDYIEVKEFIDNINPYLEMEEAVVTICDISGIDGESKKKKTRKGKKPVDGNKLIASLLDHMYLNEGKITKEEYEKIVSDDFTTKWGSTLFSNLQATKSPHPWKPKEQAEVGNIIKEPDSSDVDFIELTENWMEYLEFLKSKGKKSKKSAKKTKPKKENKAKPKKEDKAKEEDSFEPEPEKEEEEDANKSEEIIEDSFIPKSLDEVEEGLKIKWKSPSGEILNGYIDKINKEMKKNINITIYDGDSETQLTVPLSEINIIR